MHIGTENQENRNKGFRTAFRFREKYLSKSFENENDYTFPKTRQC